MAERTLAVQQFEMRYSMTPWTKRVHLTGHHAAVPGDVTEAVHPLCHVGHRPGINWATNNTRRASRRGRRDRRRLKCRTDVAFEIDHEDGAARRGEVLIACSCSPVQLAEGLGLWTPESRDRFG